jgi:hypothetical protein
MAVTLHDLIEHVRTQRPDGDALIRLAEATTVAGNLAKLADELVGHFVEEARGAGASWSQIGESLGVTKQAAQKRYVGSRQWGRPSWLSEEIADAVQLANEEAKAYGHEYIDAEHLVLAVLQSDSAATAVRDLDVLPDEVCAAIVAALPPASRSRPQVDPLPFTPRTKEMLFDARRIAKRFGHPCVEPEHVLLTAVSTRKGGAAKRVLNQFGITDRKLNAWLSRRAS